jgi:DNA invertase Pin-like site-specific DNA recombinase
VDADKVAELRAQGASWRAVARELGVGIGTVRRVAQERSKNEAVAVAPSG